MGEYKRGDTIGVPGINIFGFSAIHFQHHLLFGSRRLFLWDPTTKGNDKNVFFVPGAGTASDRKAAPFSQIALSEEKCVI